MKISHIYIGLHIIINSMKYFELDNYDIGSSKRHSTLTSLIFILKCFTKPYLVEIQMIISAKVVLGLFWSPV